MSARLDSEGLLQKLRLDRAEVKVYSAGYPRFDANFSRDGILAFFLLADPARLKDQLIYSAVHQGINFNPITGEEPGKIHHELPGAVMRGRSTFYNACDASSLFILGHQWYREMSGDESFAVQWKDSIRSAADYIIRHTQDGFFVEDPALAKTDKFALKVTYWKDSSISDRKGGEPAFPVTYTLAHYQARNALSAASLLLGDPLYAESAKLMTEKGRELFDRERGIFILARDGEGPIPVLTSDVLHLLFYLEPGEIPAEDLRRNVQAAARLATVCGYRTLDPALEAPEKDPYHARTVWPFEQAFIHIGLVKHGFTEEAQIAARVMEFLDSEAEYFLLEDEGPRKAGCDPQLWTIGAKKYFQSVAADRPGLISRHTGPAA